MKKLKLDNFNIKKIINIIGHYDDYKVQNRNEFKEEDENGNIKTVKKFRKFEVKLELSPKHKQSYIVSGNDKEIGDFVNSRVDIIPFIKNDQFYYYIRDNGTYHAKFNIILNDYYTYNEGSKIIKEKINSNTIEYVWEYSIEKLEEIFMGRQKYFNYMKEIEWMVD